MGQGLCIAGNKVQVTEYTTYKRTQSTSPLTSVTNASNLDIGQGNAQAMQNASTVGTAIQQKNTSVMCAEQ